MTNEADFMRALSARLRNLREDAGLRQDDISRKAKSLGLAWGRSSVAALEAGLGGVRAWDDLRQQEAAGRQFGRWRSLMLGQVEEGIGQG